MYYTGLLKRMVPFLLTFAAGLLFASIFVTVAAPSFGNFRRASHKRHEIKMLKAEQEALKAENERLRAELESLRRHSLRWETPVFPNELDSPLAVPQPPKVQRVR